MTTHIIFRKRSRWKRPALTALTVVLVSLAALFAIRFFTTRSATAGAGDVAASQRSVNDIATESLSKKIAIDNQQRQELQAKRAQLTAVAPPERRIVLTPAERTRHELVSKLIYLLALERQYPEGSPETTDTRKQIDSLQSQIAEMPLPERRVQPVAPAATTDTGTQVAETDRQLSLNEAQTQIDLQQLRQLERAKELAGARHSRHETLSVPAIVSASLILGVIAAGLAFAVSRGSDTRIRDEAVLRDLLPQTVKFLGTVPHMGER